MEMGISADQTLNFQFEFLSFDFPLQSHFMASGKMLAPCLLLCEPSPNVNVKSYFMNARALAICWLASGQLP
jgi:hypothetical protein